MKKFGFVKDEKLKKQLKFILVIDNMKNIFRRNLLADGSRRENDAEHSWSLAMLAMLFEEYSAEKVDMEKTLKIALVHDLVEVYAGDTFAYDLKGNEDKLERETKAAQKLFEILEPEQGGEIRDLWNEFEEKKTPEARYANAIDRVQPLINNYMTDGYTWKDGDVHAPQIYKRNEIVRTAAPELWELVEGIVDDSIESGILKP